MPVILRFTKPWLAAKSPITLRFGGEQVPEPPVRWGSIGIQFMLGQDNGLRAAADLSIQQDVSVCTEAISLNEQHPQSAAAELVLALNHPEQTTAQLMLKSEVARYRAQTLHQGWQALAPLEHRALQRSAVGLASRARHQVAFNCEPERFACAQTLAVQDGMKAQSDTQLGWQTTKTERCADMLLRWGPHAPMWRCSSRYRPPKSPITLRFSKPAEQVQSPVRLRFTPSATVCEWDDGGGLIHTNPTLPPLDLSIPIEPQLRRSYLMTPEITCSRLSDGEAIVLRSVSLQHSRSQWAPTCNLVFSSKGDAQRADGQAVKLSVNGYDFYLLLESPSSSKSFGRSVYSAAGRGLLAELASPNKKAINYTNQVARSFMGLAADAVANTSWTVATTLTDYTVPAGAWSYAGKTPAEALHLMAASIGAMLDVDGATKTITFIPRWPVSPWAVASATPDVVLHDGVILDISERREIRPSANAVFVRGEQQGVAAKVKLFGTAGDEFAGDVVDKLITDNQAARLRGTHELAEAGDKQQTQIRTKLMADLPPIRPGMLVGVRLGADLFKATCDSWQLTATVNGDGKVVVNQSLTLLRNAA